MAMDTTEYKDIKNNFSILMHNDFQEYEQHSIFTL